MRKSGILMHISSLPGSYGIGRMGKEAYQFVDFLVKSKQSCWQILPVSPTSYGDSPYQSFSVHAGNPYFIDPESLEKDGLLEPEDYKDIDWGGDLSAVDYGNIYENAFKVLRRAHKRFRKKPAKGYAKFAIENKGWLYEYGLFMALKEAHGGKAWYEWEEPLRLCKGKAVKAAAKKYADDIDFWCFVQFEYFKQWKRLKKYANVKGVRIIGDIPIYCAYDSVEVWAHPEYFYLDKDKKPIEVAGCPPDVFSEDGQLWGNPLYRWDYMAKEKYRWWIERIAAAFRIYDTVRIDHFRGFESYYCIPYGAKTARKGQWRKGPDMKLFKEVNKRLGQVDIIAEDLGFLTKKVVKMLEASGYPGMKILEFAFDGDTANGYLPHNYKSSNSICYTGTHDNETVAGWAANADKKTVAFCKKYLGVRKDSDIPWAMVKLCWSSVADTAVAQLQDILGLDNTARMNTPSTVGENWRWRLTSMDILDDELSQKLADLTELYNRVPAKRDKTNEIPDEPDGTIK
ncbi:MAG: 4-alpha-glucanotransferase [Ruminococcus sp.]|nr:4-alpha-glucanotransferase [Ruminococcus sp.]